MHVFGQSLFKYSLHFTIDVSQVFITFVFDEIHNSLQCQLLIYWRRQPIWKTVNRDQMVQFYAN